MTRNKAAFTLIELILVMALLATLLAVAAPTLHSLKGPALEQEASRLLAAAEYARTEAISQGIPMVLWIEPEAGRFGVRPKDGYTGNPAREAAWTLPEEIRFDLFANVNAVFEPRGTPDPETLQPIVLVHRSEDRITFEKSGDGWGYEIADPSE